MNLSQNHQEFLAEQFFIEEITVNHESYSAVMMIKRWKFITRIPNIGKRIIEEAGLNIRNSFFSFVTPSAVLKEEPMDDMGSIN